MAELKRVWLVLDAPTGTDGTHDYLWDDLKDDEHRLAHYYWEKEGHDIDQFVRIYWGGGKRTLREHPRVYDDAASAKADAEKRMAKAKAKYDKRKGKTSSATKVLARFRGSRA